MSDAVHGFRFGADGYHQLIDLVEDLKERDDASTLAIVEALSLL